MRSRHIQVGLQGAGVRANKIARAVHQYQIEEGLALASTGATLSSPAKGAAITCARSLILAIGRSCGSDLGSACAIIPLPSTRSGTMLELRRLP
ncbi:hypothetical protein ATE48_14535 [Candidatus Viadribacter manganicus]|uniref:Uncharacterized protein n=1 Tax=Candidatus Viadribacter manganicus TaxID=1759059 RepID=A0A1B1AKF3_9PROT|nr:hypothetical protein ATE48_14535 [Candidatus Viadribacter manganicus]